MDEMLIQSNFTKSIIVKLITKLLKSKLGIDPKIDLGDIHVVIGEKTADINLSLNAKVDKGELFKAVSKVM